MIHRIRSHYAALRYLGYRRWYAAARAVWEVI
jgi:hypothetical protein